jgi:hypothetical protein
MITENDTSAFSFRPEVNADVSQTAIMTWPAKATTAVPAPSSLTRPTPIPDATGQHTYVILTWPWPLAGVSGTPDRLERRLQRAGAN